MKKDYCKDCGGKGKIEPPPAYTMAIAKPCPRCQGSGLEPKAMSAAPPVEEETL